MNPKNSIWNKPRDPHIHDMKLYHKWIAIKNKLTQPTEIRLLDQGYTRNMIVINNQCIIAKNSLKFRLVSQLDWACYTTTDLAQAIDNCTVDVYYERMLMNSRSDPNEWKDHAEEMQLKTHYAVRANRAHMI